MTKKPTSPGITSWSFSRFVTYTQCPAKARYQFVLKIPEPGNEAMARGDKIHKLIEAYLRGESSRLASELQLVGSELKALRAQFKRQKLLAPLIEEMWGFDREWQQVAWNDWTNCWLRIKLDLAYFDGPDALIMVDWKTGKLRPEEAETYLAQLELYVLGAFLRFPHLTAVTPRLHYVDLGVTYPVVPSTYTRADLERLKKLWAGRVAPMMRDKAFAPRPNNRCQWCHYRKANAANGGGQCRF